MYLFLYLYRTMKGYIEIEKYKELEAKYQMLFFQMEQLKRLVYGAKSERFTSGQNPEQLQLFSPPPTEEPASTIHVAAHEKKRTPAKKKPARLLLPEHLEKREVIIEPDQDTTGMVKVSEERTNILMYTPAELYVKVLVRPYYKAKSTSANSTSPESSTTQEESTKICIAPMPSRFIEKCIADETLLAAIIADKYVDHLPLYRTRERLNRLGVLIPKSTMCGWVAQSADRLLPMFEKLVELVLKATYLMIDETRIEVQVKKPPAKRKKPKKSKTHRGYYWGYLAVEQQLLFFDYNSSRSATNPMARLKQYAGTIQTDAYEVYDQVSKAYPDLIHYHCLNHGRREFEKALANDQQLASHALQEIQILYAIERHAREQDWSVEQCYQIRQEKSKPVLEALYKWMEEQSPKTLPKSPIGKAMGYMLKRKKTMMHYLTDGRLNIDTNPIENAIRPIAVGRKNYLFAGSHEAAQRGAMFYSFFACCKMHEVDPVAWLTDVMQRLPNHPINKIEELLPHLWTPQQTQDPA